MEKNMNKFLASVLSKTETLSDEQVTTIQDILFPPEDSTPRAAISAARKMAIDFERFNAQYEKEKANVKNTAKVMTDAELEALAEMM